MKKLIADIENYIPFNEQEVSDKKVILNWLKKDIDVLTRNNTDAHLTGSAWVVSQDFKKILMVYHNIFDSWAWIGGHADGDSDLLRVAIKEVKEESGVEHIEVLSPDIFSLEVLCVDGHIKRGEYVSSHVHLNVTYLLSASTSDCLRIKPDENSGVEWVNIEDVNDRVTEIWIKEKIYSKLFKKAELFSKG
ncbi:MAG: NUDIX hydrolase [Bacilli bacterium]|nr:NUDIX hydrolase [Bacilli bacterium]